MKNRDGSANRRHKYRPYTIALRGSLVRNTLIGPELMNLDSSSLENNRISESLTLSMSSSVRLCKILNYARCNKGRSSRTFLTLSISSKRSINFVDIAAPRTGVINPRAFATTSSRVIGFSGVPRAFSTRSVR